MFTYTVSRNHFGNLAKDSTPGTLTVADTLINQQTKRLVNKRDWPFREGTRDVSTVAGQQNYKKPADCGKLKSIYVTVGSTKYIPRECSSREEWDEMNAVSSSSDMPQWFYAAGNEILLYPIPATSITDALTFVFSRDQKDLSIADYTTGGILTATNGGTTIVGTGTAWTTKMNGRFIRITDSNSDNTGDGEWYEIDTVTSATQLSLVTPYNGLSIAAGSAPYIIGQVSILPEDAQEVPILKALEIYFTSIKPKPAISALFKELHQDAYADMFKRYGSATSSPVINDPDEDDDDC